MLLSLIKVKGHSMEPYLKDGSFFICSSLIYKIRKPMIGDIILFKYSGDTIVKKISLIENDKFFIEGLNKKDSKNFPPIKRFDILGKVIFKL